MIVHRGTVSAMYHRTNEHGVGVVGVLSDSHFEHRSVLEPVESEDHLVQYASQILAEKIRHALYEFEQFSGKTYFQFVEDLNDRVGSF
jgi:hypothetical protein